MSPVKRMQSRRRSDAILGGQGSHLADLRSSLASEKVQPRYPDEEAAFSTGPPSPEPRHRRIDSGVAGLEGPQQESKKDVNGWQTGVTDRGIGRDAQPERSVSMRDSSLGTQDKPGISPGQKQQMGSGKVGAPDEKEAAASAAASAYFQRKSNIPVEPMRPGKAMHSLSKSKEAPVSAWGKGREYRPLAHDPLAGVPRRDSSTLGSDASPSSTPFAARKTAPQRTVQPAPRAVETGQKDQTEYKPEGYPGTTEGRGQGGYQKQYEAPISEGPELYPEAPAEERQQYERGIGEDQATQQGAPIYETQYEQPIDKGQEMTSEVPMQERQYERPLDEGPEIAAVAFIQPTAVQPSLYPHISQHEHEFVTVEEITAREEATRRAVMEEAMARRKAAEEVASREAVTREAAARETIARETAQEEIAVMEAATREAYDKETLARESAVAELATLQEATRQAMAREEAAREAATASIQSTEAATREAVAREALTKQTVAERIATREVVTREAIAREAAARETANREAAIKQANTREVAAEEVAVREAALREGGFDEAIARDAALREVAAEENAAFRDEGEGFMPQEPGAREILVREPGPGSVAAGGAFAEEVPPERMATGGAVPATQPATQPAGAVVAAAPMAEPVGQAPRAKEDLGAQAREKPTVQPQSGVEPGGGRSASKEEMEHEKKREKEERNLERERTKEEKELEKQRSRQEKKLERQRTKEEKARQAELRKEEKEAQKQQEKTNKQLKRSQKKREKEEKRRGSMRSQPETANQGQGGTGLLAKIRRASRSLGVERPNDYGMDRTVPNGVPAAQSGRA
ncbi:hypothetical protein ACJ72_04020 [Emergomyces africanus]|uniref:Uncharacterized protein n=1 Tax=Emergomyces africanus TaxID=1955775 RepID=A0A1B7NXZ1_9EURO|nr:hypothetical protein ACJ72_04020 [Emergomyces africanus]